MKLRLLLVGAFGLVAAGVLVSVLLVGTRETAAESRFRGSVPPPGIALPAFALRDHAGRIVRSEDLDGKVVALTFLSTACREACPPTAGYIGRAFERLGPGEREQIEAIAISIDPAVDTRAEVAKFLELHRVEGILQYLIGTEPELRPVWDATFILSAFDTGESDRHSVPVRIYDPGGSWVSTLHLGADLTPKNLAHDLRAALG